MAGAANVSQQIDAEKGEEAGACSESTCTSGCDTPVQYDPALSRLAVDTFRSTERYLQGELQMTLEDYTLLARMNRCMHEKYSQMAALTGQVTGAMAEINSKYAALDPVISQLDDIESSLNRLEHVTNQLDVYSRQIEQAVKAAVAK